MSSLLKALKQQQSPLLKQTSILDASLMASQTGSRRWGWLVWPAALILGGAVGAGATRWNEAPSASDALVAERFSWGQTQSVEPISWDAEPAQEIQQTAAVNSQQQRSEENQTNWTEKAEVQREALDLSSVSPDLLQRFEAAVNDTSGNDNTQARASVIPPLSELSQSFQQQVPAFSYDSHMYRSSASQRWVELNGLRLYEGDALNQLTILRIEPQKVVLVMDSEAFSQAALEDWRP
ncbi:general secretion pathway protein GspB [Idiomarina aminovorans]|uniref:general secretion pathway protein GspB n=1 Tax=Idiomarina aminovorans TaxID=2914829 RepID=UPI002004DEA9|nr:general secretion pathway protein GspB [Idiomarina sp. ATCH4]MCK7459330.1 general secretion pathway protein GspB [Idiomarina sp. ATCH4]